MLSDDFSYPTHWCDTRRRDVERQLRMFQHLAPEMAAMHPLSATGPQECTEITAQVFQSLRYEMTHRVPSYQRWLDGAGHLTATVSTGVFSSISSISKAAGAGFSKSPDHVHALDAIEAVYPDCGIVFVHRDPLRVAASAMKLTDVVRRPFTRHLDKAEMGGQVLGRVVEAAETAVAMGNSARSRRIFHLHYARFAGDPLAVIEELYRHFDIELTPQTRRRMTAHLVDAPRPRNRYSFDEFGLDPSDLCPRFEFYMDHFEVQRESATWKKFRKNPPTGRGLKFVGWAAFAGGATLLAILVFRTGLAALAGAISTLGFLGLPTISLVHVPITGLLGTAWWAIAGDTRPSGVSRFAWARALRDAGAEALPFSQLGGYVLGARAVAPWRG